MLFKAKSLYVKVHTSKKQHLVLVVLGETELFEAATFKHYTLSYFVVKVFIQTE